MKCILLVIIENWVGNTYYCQNGTKILPSKSCSSDKICGFYFDRFHDNIKFTPFKIKFRMLVKGKPGFCFNNMKK